jgi:di/tricarboxylate transporter
MKTSEKLYWLKVGIAVLAGFGCLGLQVYVNLDGNIVFLLGTLIYLGASDLLSTMFKLERGHGLKVAIGAYLFTWVMTWALLYTIVHPPAPIIS